MDNLEFIANLENVFWFAIKILLKSLPIWQNENYSKNKKNTFRLGTQKQPMCYFVLAGAQKLLL